MKTKQDFIEFVCEQIKGVGNISYKKMFGEYMIYVNEKPILLVCENTVYIKMRDEIKGLMTNADIGEPYKGAKQHYILEIDDSEFSKRIVTILERIIPLPKSKNKYN